MEGSMVNRPEPNEKLVKVFDCEQESEALVVRGLLESAGIECLVSSLDAEQDLFPIGGVVIRVREGQCDEARRLIAEYRADHADDIADENPEDEFMEEPPGEA
jgi:hypothetical protein